MSLKDDLIKRANSGDTFAPKKQEDDFDEDLEKLEEDDIDLSEELDNELEEHEEDNDDDFGDIDLSSALDDMDSFSSFEEELDDPEPEPEPVFEPEPEPEPAPAPKRRRRRNKAKSYDVDEEDEERIAAEQYAASNRAEAVFEQEKPFRKADNSLGTKLVDLAKGIVLRDMLEHFESEIVTTKALTKMVESYLENKNVSIIANGNAILSAVVDEVIESGYEEEHYGDMTKDILLSVKSDL